MTLNKRLRVGAASLIAATFAATVAMAATPQALSSDDARSYASAFAAVDQGDFVGAEITAAQIQDKSLLGYISFRQLMHPTAHKASFDELCTWLTRFKDLPLAEKVFSLASKRKPSDADDPPVPEVAGLNSARSEITKPAREAFYSGDARRAYQLAVSVGERWIAGLAAWRLGEYTQARDYFAQLARDEGEDPWLRAAGAFWAARSAGQLNDPAAARLYLKLAAAAPQTFYGMIAERQMEMAQAAAVPEDRIGELLLTSYRPSQGEVSKFVAGNTRAHRAAALAQIGRYDEARQEVRAGLALARNGDERQNWNALAAELGGVSNAISPRYQAMGDYQTPPLEPRSGFTIDRALVYAIVRQESGFNAQAMSPVGAIGLMQVMPASAALAERDNSLKFKVSTLMEPSMNLRIGQDYIAYLMDRGVGTDLLRVVAAYNAGPGAVLNTIQKVGDKDPLLLIESLPALETRNYVEKVVQAYWTYKKIFGEGTPTLDAVATGAQLIDARLDLANPGGQQAQPSSQSTDIASLISAASLD